MGHPEYFGREVRRAAFGGLLLSEYAYEPHTLLPAHEHASAYFMLVLSGRLVERSCCAEFVCAPSTLLFHREGTSHTNIFGAEPARCFGIQFDAATLARLKWRAPPPGRSRTWQLTSPALLSLAYKLRRELQRADDLTPIVAEGLALALLGETVRGASGGNRVRPRWLQAAHEMIQDEAGKDITLTALARCAGVHAVTLARAYRASFGRTVGEAVRARRLERAIHLLLQTDQPITQVALATGFADHSHFSRTFRQQFGVTPQHFRRDAKRVPPD